MMDTPRVTVLMAIHEDNPFLDEAVQSVLDQTFADFEFLIVANGPSDALWAKLRSYRDPRIRLLRTALQGVAFAANLGISEARGTYVARMDSDDLVDPAKLAKQVEYLDCHPRVALVGTWVTLIDESGAALASEAARFETNAQIRSALPYRCPIIHASVLFRRSILLKVKGYLHGHMSEDHEMFIRMARDPEVEFAVLPERLYSYRKHAGQATSPRRAKEAYYGIAGFLFSEFLRTKNPKYLFGIAIVHPWRRALLGRSLRRRAGSATYPVAAQVVPAPSSKSERRAG